MKEDERAATICGARALESVATRAPRLSARGANANANARASDGVGVGGVDRPRPATGKNEEDAAVALAQRQGCQGGGSAVLVGPLRCKIRRDICMKLLAALMYPQLMIPVFELRQY